MGGVGLISFSALLFSGGYYITSIICFVLTILLLFYQPKRLDFYADKIILNHFLFKTELMYSDLSAGKLRWTNSKTGFVIDLITKKRKYSFEFNNKYSTADLFNILIVQNIKLEIDKTANWIELKNSKYVVKDFYPRNENECIRQLEIEKYLSNNNQAL